MESRILLSAITGTIYDDVDSSGTKTAQDHTLGEWQVYIDIDQNGVLNSLPSGAMEPSVLANAGGDYSINMNGFATGLYRVTEVVQAGWTPTAPLSRDVSFKFIGSAGASLPRINLQFATTEIRDCTPEVRRLLWLLF